MIQFVLWPTTLKELYNAWSGDRNNFLLRGKPNEEAYYNDVEGTGTLYTKKQLAKINETLNISTSINFQYPKANQKLALLLKANPSHRFVSRKNDQQSKDYARGIDRIKFAILYKSKARKHIKEFAKEILTLGIGIIRNVEEPFFQEGEMGISVEHVKNENFIGDSNLQEPDSEAMEGYFVEKEITMLTAKRKYGKYLIAINNKFRNTKKLAQAAPTGKITMEFFAKTTSTMPSAKSTISGFFDKQKITVKEFTDKVFSTCYYVKNPKGVIEKKFLENEDHGARKLIKQNAVYKEDNIFVRETLMLGDYIVDITTKGWLTYPVQLAFFEWGGKLYNTYSMLWFTKGMQEGFDKIIHIMLMNGILANNPGWEAPYNSIKPEDVKNYELHGNNPQFIKFYKPINIDGKVYKPEKLKPDNISNFYPLVLNMFADGISSVTGVHPILEGNMQNNPTDTLGGLQQFQNSAMDRIMLSLEEINDTLMYLGLNLGEMILIKFEPNRDYQYYDRDGVSISAKLTKKQVNQLKLLQYDVTSVPAQGHPTLKNSVAVELFKIAQSTPSVEERSYFTNKALELLDIAEVDDVLEDLDVIRNLKGRVESLLEQNKRNIELMKQSQNSEINAKKESRLQSELVSIYKRLITAEEQTKASTEIDKLKDEIKKLKKEKEPKEA